MSLFDWVEMGFASKGEEIPGFTGAFSVTIGDTVSGSYGAYYDNYFGPYVLMCCDPEAMLLGPLEHYLPLASGLMSGIGGMVTFCYGPSISSTYVGAQVAVRRAPNVGKSSDRVLARVPGRGPVQIREQ